MPNGESTSATTPADSKTAAASGENITTDFKHNRSSWKFNLSSVVNIVHRKQIKRSTGRNTNKTCESVGDDISYQNDEYNNKGSMSVSVSNVGGAASNNSSSSNNNNNNNNNGDNDRYISRGQSSTPSVHSQPICSSSSARTSSSIFGMRKKNKYRGSYKRNRRRHKKYNQLNIQQQQYGEDVDFDRSSQCSSYRSAASKSGRFSIRSVPTGGLAGGIRNSYSGVSRRSGTQFAQSSASMLASGKQLELDGNYNEALEYYVQALDISQKQVMKKYVREQLKDYSTTHEPDGGYYSAHASDNSLSSNSNKQATSTSNQPNELNYTSIDSSARKPRHRKNSKRDAGTTSNNHRINKLSTTMTRKPSATLGGNCARAKMLDSIDSSLKGLDITDDNQSLADDNSAAGSTYETYDDSNCDNHHLLALWFLVLLHIKMSLANSSEDDTSNSHTINSNENLGDVSCTNDVDFANEMTNSSNASLTGDDNDNDDKLPATVQTKYMNATSKSTKMTVKARKDKEQHHRSEVQTYLLRLYQHVSSDRVVIPEDWLLGLDDETSYVLLDVLMEINYFPLALRLAQFIDVDDRRIKYEMIKGGSFTRRSNDSHSDILPSSQGGLTYIEKLEECRGSDDIDLEKQVLLSLTRAYGQIGNWENAISVNTELIKLLASGQIRKQNNDSLDSSKNVIDDSTDDDVNCSASIDDEDFYNIYSKYKAVAAEPSDSRSTLKKRLSVEQTFSDELLGGDSHHSATSIEASSSEFYQALRQRAEIYLAQGKQDEAWKALKRAVRYSKKGDKGEDNGGSHSDNDDEAEDDKSDTSRDTHDGLGSVVHIKHQEEDDHELRFLQAKAELLYRMGYLNDSLVAHGELLQYLRNNKSPLCPEVAKTLYAMGHICIKARDYSKAIQYYSEELQVTKQAVGTTNLEVSRILHEIGKLYDTFLGDYSRALKYYQKAYKVEARLLEECIQQEKMCLDCIKQKNESSTRTDHNNNHFHNQSQSIHNHHNTGTSCSLHSQKYHEIYTNIKGTQQCIGRIHYKLGDFTMALKTSFPHEGSVPLPPTTSRQQQPTGSSNERSVSVAKGNNKGKIYKQRFSFTTSKKKKEKS